MRTTASILTALPLASASAVAAPLQDALQPMGIQAAHIHDLWRLTLAICAVVFAAVLAAFLYALWRAPHSAEDTPPDVSSLASPESRLHRRIFLAVAVSTVLLFVLLIADVFTSRALARMRLNDAINVEVVGHQWWWEIRYVDEQPSRRFTTANEMHIPVGRPAVITLKSNDVIHTFWVPNLHGKKDLIPGRTATIELRADQPGTYRGQCAEFCGLEHALMAFSVVAEPPDAYETWAQEQRRPAEPVTAAQAARGQQVFMSTTCVMCHTIQGTSANGKQGPDLTHLASRQMIASGALPNTKEHLAGWILAPQKFKPGANMPATPLGQDDLEALLAYLGSLK